jgi:hypothetical protein
MEKRDMKKIRVAGTIVGSAVCLLVGQARADVVIFDTLGLATAGSAAVDGVPWAQSFVMTFTTTALKEVILGMGSSSGTGTFTVSIYGNGVGNVPGSLVTVLNGSASPTVGGNYLYTPSYSAPYLVSGNTYWVVASENSVNPYNWTYGIGSPSPGTEVGLAGPAFPSGWINEGSGHPFRMEVVAVPEAATYLMDGVMILAAGFGVYHFRRKAAAAA